MATFRCGGGRRREAEQARRRVVGSEGEADLASVGIADRVDHEVGEDLIDARAVGHHEGALPAGVAQLLPQVEQLARRQPELGLVATAVLPLAGA